MTVQLPKKTNNFIFTPAGDRISPQFTKVYDENLKREIVKQTGTFDIYEFIQASECQSDLAMLRQQMISTGQVPTVSDEVVDYSLFPQDIHELNNVVNSSAERFNALPDSIKVVFGNKDNFLASLVKGTYEQDIVNYYQAAAKSAAPGPEKGSDVE